MLCVKILIICPYCKSRIPFNVMEGLPKLFQRHQNHNLMKYVCKQSAGNAYPFDIYYTHNSVHITFNTGSSGIVVHSFSYHQEVIQSYAKFCRKHTTQLWVSWAL